MNPIDWLMDKWYARVRAIDLAILWPVCKEHAPDLNNARFAFLLHASNDRAWLWLGMEKVIEIVGGLE